MSEKTKSPPQFSSEEFYKLVRGQIEHEDNLMGTRLNWFVASQSFLFSAYAIVTSNLTGKNIEWVNEQQRLLFSIIPVIAIFVSILISISCTGGIFAMHRLRHLYATHVEHAPDRGLPPVQGFAHNYVLGQATPILLPPGFIAVWMILLVHGLR
jgi:hypothetical protein